MPHPLNLSLSRIYDANGAVVGAAFLVGDQYLLTCAHVLLATGIKAKQPELSSEIIRLDFPLLAANKLCFARVCFWDEDKDIAGLELTSDPPAGVSPVRLLRADDVWDHKFRTFGFPENFDDGGWASGVLKGRTAGNVIQLEDIKEQGYQVKLGFSGAPVWDETLGGVVGMVSLSDTDKKAKVAFCIPFDVLSIWGQVVNEGIQGENGVCSFTKIEEELSHHKSILRNLKEQTSLYGIAIPVHILVQIEHEEVEISRIERNLNSIWK